MAFDAIPTDVSQQQDGQDGAEQTLSPRDLAMQEIEAQLAEQQAAAGLASTGQTTEQAPSTPQTAEVLADDQLDKVMVRVKVDGLVVEMPLSEVTKGYQKDAVASRRLAAAAEERKALDARQRELDERERQLTATAAAPSPGEASGDVEAQIRAAMSALVEGDEEAAAAALTAMFQGRAGTTPAAIDEDALVTKAAARIEAQQAAADQASAWQEFVASNPHFADETSKQRQYGDYLFDSVYAPKIQAGEISYREALMQTSQDVATVFRPQSPPAPSALEQKQQRKAAIDNLPVAGARAVRQAPAQESVDDVLEEMRRLRGQPV